MKKAVGLLASATMMLAACGGSAAPESGAPNEGIAVHGDWTIDIYDADGTLDQHVEFSNALVASGRLALTQLLTGNRSAGSWRIDFGDPDGGDLCQGLPVCQIDEVSAVSPTGSSVQLTGSTTVDAAGTVGEVNTLIGLCFASVAPSDCVPSNFQIFTSKTLDPADAPAVEAGQQVQVQVDISFTSG